MNKDEMRQKNSMQEAGSVIRAGILGMLIGAAGTAYLVLRDREMRKRATKKAGEAGLWLSKWSDKALKNVQTTLKEKQDGAKKGMAAIEKIGKDALKGNPTTRIVH